MREGRMWLDTILTSKRIVRVAGTVVLDRCCFVTRGLLIGTRICYLLLVACCLLPVTLMKVGDEYLVGNRYSAKAVVAYLDQCTTSPFGAKLTYLS